MSLSRSMRLSSSRVVTPRAGSSPSGVKGLSAAIIRVATATRSPGRTASSASASAICRRSRSLAASSNASRTTGTGDCPGRPSRLVTSSSTETGISTPVRSATAVRKSLMVAARAWKASPGPPCSASTLRAARASTADLPAPGCPVSTSGCPGGSPAVSHPRMRSRATVRPRNRSPPRAALRCPRALRVKWLRASPGSGPAISQGRGSRGHTWTISVTGTNRSNRPRSDPSTKIPARACPAASMTGPPL